MLNTIKQWLNWPSKGIGNISELGAYFKQNWLSLLVLLIITLLIFWIIRKILGWISSMLS